MKTWWLGLLLGCSLEPAPPCADRAASVCVHAAQAMIVDEPARRVEALAMLDDACGRLADRAACRVAGEGWLAGWGASTLDPEHAAGAGSPFGKGLSYLHRACELGEGEVCWDLGSRTLKGAGVPKDDARAAAWFDKACAAGSLEGCVDRGLLFESGRPAPKDEAAAVRLYQQACDAGHGRGCTKLGWALRGGVGVSANQDAGTRLLERGCELGFAPGCGLAAIALEGEPPAGDPVRRVRALLAGAGLLDRRAVDHLLALHREGRVEDASWEQLETRLTPQCEGGTGAACLIGSMVDDARGRLDDAARAASYRSACAKGADEACGLLHRLIGEARATLLPEDTRLLLPERGCAGGLADVCVDLGEGYEQGRYEVVDLDAAERAFQRACSLGDTRGCEGLTRVKGRLRPLPAP
jgi:TPR repeat protein